jgi:hypothetical protein
MSIQDQECVEATPSSEKFIVTEEFVEHTIKVLQPLDTAPPAAPSGLRILGHGVGVTEIFNSTK